MASRLTQEQKMERFLRKGTRRIKPSVVRARKAKHARQYPPHWREEICAAQGWKCAYCRRSIRRDGKGPSDRLATLDHVIPLSRGGKNCRKNIVGACVRCNTAKGSMSADEFRATLAPCGTRPEGGDGEAGLVRSTSDAVTPKAAGAQTELVP